MKKDRIKSHLLIADRFLGALLHFRDKAGRGCLKLSFRNKIEGLGKGTDVMTLSLVLPPSKASVGLDISYKFRDSLLEVKKVSEGKVIREFYAVPLPMKACLFTLQLRDWEMLDVCTNPPEWPLSLTPSGPSNSVVVIFSFLGPEGLPLKPPQYDCPIMRSIELPEEVNNSFWIGIAGDPNPSLTHDFVLGIPNHPSSSL